VDFKLAERIRVGKVFKVGKLGIVCGLSLAYVWAIWLALAWAEVAGSSSSGFFLRMKKNLYYDIMIFCSG
jgi:hypothetical protein